MKPQTSSFSRTVVGIRVSRPLKNFGEKADLWLNQNKFWVVPLGVSILIFAASLWAFGWVPEVIDGFNSITESLRSLSE